MPYLKLENYEFSRFFCEKIYRLEDTKCLESHKVLKSSPLQKVSEWVGDRFILTDLIIIYTIWKQPASSFFRNNNYCFPNEINIGHCTKKVTEKGVDLFIKYLQGPFYADFTCREGISCYIWIRNTAIVCQRIYSVFLDSYYSFSKKGQQQRITDFKWVFGLSGPRSPALTSNPRSPAPIKF